MLFRWLPGGNCARHWRALPAPDQPGEFAYRYRIAFGAWINDMRRRPLALENWPAPQFDDETVASAIEAMDLQAAAGFNFLDAWGLFVTYGWPPDITSAVDDQRRRRLHRLQDAARRRNIRFVLGLGTYSWGYDKIIAADPAVRGRNPDGTPHPHAMCDANPKSFDYVKRIIDFTLGQFDFGAVHMESCDLGCCWCPRCAGKDGVVAYNARINRKTADYIKQKWPDKMVYVITINWAPPGKEFNDDELATGRRAEQALGLRLRPGAHRLPGAARPSGDRSLPACTAPTELPAGSGSTPTRDGTRLPISCPIPSGPARPGAAVRRGRARLPLLPGPRNQRRPRTDDGLGGRVLSDTRRSSDAVLGEILDVLYRPRDAAAAGRLRPDGRAGRGVVLRPVVGRVVPQNLAHRDAGRVQARSGPLGTSPGPATYLKEPCLDAKGRKAYRQGLAAILAELPKLEGQCDDQGRLANIQRSVIVTLNSSTPSARAWASR